MASGKGETAGVGRGEAMRAHLKATARRLFALHGIDTVSVRDIVLAAKSRNAGAVAYYFTTKEQLVLDIVIDGAKTIEARRDRMLDALEARGRPVTVRDILEILVRSSLDLEPSDEADHTYVRFFAAVRGSAQAPFIEALDRAWDMGTRRCMDHIRRLTPDCPPPLMDQRLLFLRNLVIGVLAARELALDGEAPDRDILTSPSLVQNLVDAAQGLLGQPPSAEALRPRP